MDSLEIVDNDNNKRNLDELVLHCDDYLLLS